MSTISGTTARFLYVTDIHGDMGAYADLPELCRKHNTRTIVNGGDMLPKGRDMFDAQRECLNTALPRFFERCDAADIQFFGQFGNDDLSAFYDQWLDLTRSLRGVFDLTTGWHLWPGGLSIRGCSFVPDYPFGLKDWCLRDSAAAEPIATRGRSITTNLDGIVEIPDPRAFFASRPTLEEHLDSLVDPTIPMERAILVSHAPPAGCGLGTLWSGEDVGSKAVRRWTDRHQPLLVLSGHIHESPDVERKLRGESHHTASCGRTTCHQPGQVLPIGLTYSIVEIAGDGKVQIEWHQGIDSHWA